MANTTQTGAAASRDERTNPQSQKITTFLWFDNNADEAANYYVSIFKNSKILRSVPYGEGGPRPKGSVMVVDFVLDGQEFTALNGGPIFKFNESVSQVVHCKTQEEVDYFWEKLSEGGQKVECGWLKDKYGLSWQVVPDVLLEWIGDRDREKADRVFQAMMKMQKLDIAELQKAADGK